MAPKKKEVQKLSLGDFLADNSFGGGGSWADEVEDTYGNQPLPSTDRRTGASSYGNNDSYKGYSSIRENLPQQLPDRPPFTAHLGNLSYDATVETVNEFFEGCNIINVRIIEDRELQRPKGFAYAEFGDLEGLKQALTLDGQSFQSRSIRIKVADPPKDRPERGGFDSMRDLSNASWERKGPLPELAGARNSGRSVAGDRPEYERRGPPREFAEDNRRDLSNASWERRGPLSPVAQAEQPAGGRDGSRPARNFDLGPRGESYREDRKTSPAAWGPGEGRRDQQEGSRPPRREFSDRPERAPTAAEKDNQWRNNMRADAAPATSHEGSEAPSSPAPSAAAPVGRPKLQLAKRTVSEAPDTNSPTPSGDAKASPFGAARPIDTAARERAVEEKREQALKEKRDADEKAKEEKRLAKEAAAKEQAEADAAAKAAAEKAKEEEVANQTSEPAQETTPNADAAVTSPTEQTIPTRPREAREPRESKGEPKEQPKSRGNDSVNWRSAGADRGSTRGAHAPRGARGGARGGRPDDRRGPARANGNTAPQPQDNNTDQAPPTPTVDEDGWTTVTTVAKGRRGQGRPI